MKTVLPSRATAGDETTSSVVAYDHFNAPVLPSSACRRLSKEPQYTVPSRRDTAGELSTSGSSGSSGKPPVSNSHLLAPVSAETAWTKLSTPPTYSVFWSADSAGEDQMGSFLALKDQRSRVLASGSTASARSEPSAAPMYATPRSSMTAEL